MNGKQVTRGGRPGESSAATLPHTAFASSVSALLDRTEYRRCDKGEDLEDVYRLRYAAYKLNDLVPENPDHIVHDDFDDLPNCHRFGVYIDGHLVSTIRLHAVSKDMPYSPAMSVFADVLEPRLAAGDKFVDPSRFAADHEWSRVYPQIPYLTLRLAGMACFHFDSAYCISMIREDHAAFYKRIYHSRPIAEPRNYGGVINCDAILYQADVLAIREETFLRFPFFQSTPMEQRLMFGDPPAGELTPLTILPTAKYFRAAA